MWCLESVRRAGWSSFLFFFQRSWLNGRQDVEKLSPVFTGHELLRRCVKLYIQFMLFSCTYNINFTLVLHLILSQPVIVNRWCVTRTQVSRIDTQLQTILKRFGRSTIFSYIWSGVGWAYHCVSAILWVLSLHQRRRTHIHTLNEGRQKTGMTLRCHLFVNFFSRPGRSLPNNTSGLAAKMLRFSYALF